MERVECTPNQRTDPGDQPHTHRRTITTTIITIVIIALATFATALINRTSPAPLRIT